MTDNDARRVAATGAQAVQINTQGGCHLDSGMVLDALGSLDLDGLDILFIENVGNLVCPVEFNVGEDMQGHAALRDRGRRQAREIPPALLQRSPTPWC